MGGYFGYADMTGAECAATMLLVFGGFFALYAHSLYWANR